MTTATRRAAPSATRRGGAAPAGLTEAQRGAFEQLQRARTAMAAMPALDPAETWADAYFERMKTDD